MFTIPWLILNLFQPFQIFKRMPEWLDMESKTLRMFFDCAYDIWKQKKSSDKLKILFQASYSTITEVKRNLSAYILLGTEYEFKNEMFLQRN